MNNIRNIITRLRLQSAVRSRRSCGMALIETLVYISLFFLVSGLAFAVFYRTEEQSRALRRGADDIAASLSAGERWRADIRSATSAPVIVQERLTIKQGAAEVSYFVHSNSVWRQVTSQRPVRVLDGVVLSEFQREQREFVTAWHWNVELKRRRHTSTIRPLFTFSAANTP